MKIQQNNLLTNGAETTGYLNVKKKKKRRLDPYLLQTQKLIQKGTKT